MDWCAEQLAKTSRKFEDVYLEPWQEVAGLFEHVNATDAEVIVTIRVKDGICSLHLPRSGTAFEALQSLPILSKVAILRTDDPIEPIRIRIMPTESHQEL
jgi:hypothetical protein